MKNLKYLEQTFATGVHIKLQQEVVADINKELTMIEGLLCIRRTLGDPERRNEAFFVK